MGCLSSKTKEANTTLDKVEEKVEEVVNMEPKDELKTLSESVLEKATAHFKSSESGEGDEKSNAALEKVKELAEAAKNYATLPADATEEQKNEALSKVKGLVTEAKTAVDDHSSSASTDEAKQTATDLQELFGKVCTLVEKVETKVETTVEEAKQE